MNSKILGSHAGTISNFPLQQYIKEILSRVSSFACEASIPPLSQVQSCSVPSARCPPECPSCSPAQSSLDTPSGQTPSPGSRARVPPSAIKTKQTARDDMGPGWNSTGCVYFVQSNAGPLISAVWNDVSLRKRSQVTGKFNLLSSIIQVSFPNCVQFDLPASLQIISEKKKSNENRQFKPNPVYHYLYAKPFLWYMLPLMTMECQIFPSEFTNLAIKLFQRQAY